MFNLDKFVNDKKEQDNWPFCMLIIGPSGSGKTNTLLHLIDKLHPIDKIIITYRSHPNNIFKMFATM